MQVPNGWRLDMHEIGALYFQLLDQKDMLNRYMEIIRNNPDLMEQVRKRNPYFDLGPRTWYAYYSCLLLRNIGDDDDRTVSFYNTLTKMAEAKYLPVVTFSRNVKLTASKVYHDRKSVKRIVAPIKKFADKVIAHKDRMWSRIVPPTFNEVEACANALGPILFEYMELLNGPGATAHSGLVKGWDSIFTYAWV